MILTPEQKQAVSSWVVAGDGLSAIQRKLADQFKVSMTYMDVRFLVDDLNLALKDKAPKADASDVSKTPPPSAAKAVPGGQPAAAGEDALPPDGDDLDAGMPPEEDVDEGLPPDAGPSKVRVSVDKVVLIPGAMASGSVTFSDGVAGKWIVDNYGRPGLTEISKPGYRPSPADAQAFMQELSTTLQRRGI